MILLWLDLETTGLDSGTDAVLEVAWTLTDENLVGDSVVKSHLVTATLDLLRELDQAPEVVREMHEASGLAQELRESLYATQPSTLLADIEHLILADLVETGDADVRLAGASVHFDKSFLAVHMPELHAVLSHRIYDTSSLKVLAASVGVDLQVENEHPHRAGWDVLECLAWAVSFRNLVAPAAKLDKLLELERLRGAQEAFDTYVQNLREVADIKGLFTVQALITAMSRSSQTFGDYADLALLHLDD